MSFTWEGGGRVTIEALGKDAVVLVSAAAHPPGSRPLARLDGDATLALRVKVHACRALGDGTFRIEGRPVDLTRDARERLASLVRVT